ncbi:hypothetical protein [Dapis sp. BLCC M229]|uniref:hypothetical protein n=1 Tax=Dapis sp. BLCC M229 TaxID=3400188 RepID=UPI003CF52D82
MAEKLGKNLLSVPWRKNLCTELSVREKPITFCHTRGKFYPQTSGKFSEKIERENLIDFHF